jgi:hypothetical protein
MAQRNGDANGAAQVPLGVKLIRAAKKEDARK